jgi:hypothetical protein
MPATLPDKASSMIRRAQVHDRWPVGAQKPT